MNEFQAILVEVIFFAARFAVPALVIYIIARVLHHHVTQEAEDNEPGTVH
jgi:hypothetical protein